MYTFPMQEILEAMTLGELFALYNKHADEIRGLRETQKLIAKVIQSKEVKDEPVAPPELAQSIDVVLGMP
jgi:hypothetical protein